MTEQPSQFTFVRRGYDPDEVDQRLTEFARAIKELAAQRDQLAVQLNSAPPVAPAPAAPISSEPASFEHLGERVGSILALARDEADELKSRALAEVDQARAAHEAHVAATKADADAYAAGVRQDADTEALRSIADARRQADEILDAARRDADARMNEAQAVYEEQKATAAKAAADFEATLNERRQQHESDFAASVAEANARLDHANKLVDDARSEAETLRKEAQQEARRLVDNAELEASSVVSEAKALAARVKSDSDREVAAATQRRDSINAQLANVRQMLATLTGQPATGLDAAMAAPSIPAQAAEPGLD
ncbi:hypothetical protein [Nocardioides sp.]|uniref:hypothetical protein n=1 Tax=Nocardioides sp. TaxID=35761 RepID=UPI0026055B0A|nr:hypothetical protein [Nocardioides sp.]